MEVLRKTFFSRLLLASMIFPWVLRAQDADGETPPRIQDNSFLVEEAYNQERGVVQHINTFSRFWNSKDWVYSFTEEWPLPGDSRHQVGYTVIAAHAGAFSGAGAGDVILNYRYQLAGNGETRLALAPRLSAMLPTGDEAKGRGLGAKGLQANIPLSVVLNRRLVTHWNVGTTFVAQAQNAVHHRADTIGYNFGQSVVWLVNPRFNVLLEAVYASAQSVIAPDQTEWNKSLYISPGIRWAYNFKSGLQIVPGLAMPIGAGPTAGEKGVFLYLSLEHPFSRHGRG